MAESPVIVHGVVQVDEKFVDKLIELAVYFGEDLDVLARFIRRIADDEPITVYGKQKVLDVAGRVEKFRAKQRRARKPAAAKPDAAK